MRTFGRPIVAAIFMLGLVSGASAQQAMPGHDKMSPAEMHKMHKMMEHMLPNPSDAASTKDFKEAHMKMMKAMDIAYTGTADVDFVRGMIPHHQGAIDMARVQLTHGKDPHLRRMAEKIISDQEKEIAEMQDWLKKNVR